MIRPIEFDTARLTLRQWKEADRKPFATLCADPEVMKFFISSVLDRATSDARIAKWAKRIEEDGWGFWAIELKADSTFIGFAGLQVPAADHPYVPCVEIGWRSVCLVIVRQPESVDAALDAKEIFHIVVNPELQHLRHLSAKSRSSTCWIVKSRIGALS